MARSASSRSFNLADSSSLLLSPSSIVLSTRSLSLCSLFFSSSYFFFCSHFSCSSFKRSCSWCTLFAFNTKLAALAASSFSLRTLSSAILLACAASLANHSRFNASRCSFSKPFRLISNIAFFSSSMSCSCAALVSSNDFLSSSICAFCFSNSSRIATNSTSCIFLSSASLDSISFLEASADVNFCSGVIVSIVVGDAVDAIFK